MSIASQMVNTTEQFIKLFEKNQSALSNGMHPKVNQLRDVALNHFKQTGIPNTKVENYKYTNLQPFFRPEYKQIITKEDISDNSNPNFKCEVPQLDTYQLFTINGRFFQGNTFPKLPDGVIICSFEDFTTKYPEHTEKYYGETAQVNSDAMVALNTMNARDGFVIYIPKGCIIDNPIQVVNLMIDNTDLFVNQRNLIIAENDCQAKVMICDHTVSTQRFAINAVTEVFIGERAVFDIYGLQSQHNMTTQVAGTYITQKTGSNVMVNNLTLHSGIVRNNIYVTLDGEHCETHLYGLYLNDKNQHVDNFTFIDHVKPNCFSSELFKGVLDDYSSGSFTGKIMVRPNAQKTNAFQSNRNLLLTPDAKFNTKPQLEIYADDVKCSHGATVGQMDENALFYLRSRGLSKEEARILLMYAFTYEVIEKIKVEPLKEQIRGLVEKRFRGELDKCESCVVCGQLGHQISCL
ncbi:MAG: Fe-S cluster assembly protein SufD [Marinilabiliaceae bacterium]|nr:Fe-S cluster assembly protein SufD [Marinilabiliaceae bacterium]